MSTSERHSGSLASPFTTSANDNTSQAHAGRSTRSSKRRSEQQLNGTPIARNTPSASSRAQPEPSPTPGTVQRKRRRAVVVCKRCKLLKLKCDQARPCGACLRGGLEEECAYIRWGWDQNQLSETGPNAAAHALGSAASSPNGVLGGTAATHAVSPSPATSTAPAAQHSTSDSSIVERLARVEQRLDHLTRNGTPLSSPLQTDNDKLRTLVAQFPSQDLCRRFIAEFFRYDLMFRLVHLPSFARRTEEIISRLPDSVSMEDAPRLAMLVGAMIIAVNVSPEPEGASVTGLQLRTIMEGLLDLCEARRALVGLDYAHAQLIAIVSHTAGPESTADGTYFASARAYAAALLAGLYRDRVGESVFEAEMRRRVWWHIIVFKDLFSDRLNLGGPYPEPRVVPRPQIIADSLLQPLDAEDDPPQDSVIHAAALENSGTPTYPEWGYMDAKISFIDMLARMRAALSSNKELISRLGDALDLVEATRARVPAYFSVREPVPGAPPWVYMQACVLDVAYDDTIVHILRPHFGSPDPLIGEFALTRAVEAAHRVIATMQRQTVFVLFSWIDAPSVAPWTYGMKAFTAGMVMAYSLLSDAASVAAGRGTGLDPAEAARQLASLDAAVGNLKAMIRLKGSAWANDHALQALERLRGVIRKRSAANEASGGGETVPEVVDPYTGRSVPLPLPFAPDMDVDLPGEWVEWEVLFRDLLQGQV